MIKSFLTYAFNSHAMRGLSADTTIGKLVESGACFFGCVLGSGVSCTAWELCSLLPEAAFVAAIASPSATIATTSPFATMLTLTTFVLSIATGNEEAKQLAHSAATIKLIRAVRVSMSFFRKRKKQTNKQR
jgi:hypothetical protein